MESSADSKKVLQVSGKKTKTKRRANFVQTHIFPSVRLYLLRILIGLLRLVYRVGGGEWEALLPLPSFARQRGRG